MDYELHQAMTKIFLGLIGADDVVHGQRELSHSFMATESENRIPSPRLISSFASSTRAKNSSSLIFDESALVAVSFLAYLKSFVIRFLSSAIILNWRNSSALICRVVISKYLKILLQRYDKFCKRTKKKAVLTKSSPNLLTHSDLFTIFAPTLAKAASFGVGGPSSEALPFSVGLSLFFLPFFENAKVV